MVLITLLHYSNLTTRIQMMLWGQTSNTFFLALGCFNNSIGFIQWQSVTSSRDQKSSWKGQRHRVTLFLCCKAIYQAWSSIGKENYRNSQIDQDEHAPTLSTQCITTSTQVSLLKGELWIPNRLWHATSCTWVHLPSFPHLLRRAMCSLLQVRCSAGVNFIII